MYTHKQIIDYKIIRFEKQFNRQVPSRLYPVAARESLIKRGYLLECSPFENFLFHFAGLETQTLQYKVRTAKDFLNA